MALLRVGNQVPRDRRRAGCARLLGVRYVFLSLCLPVCRWRVSRAHRACRRYLHERQRRRDTEREPATIDPLEGDSALERREAFTQDEQPCLEIVVARRQPEAFVEAQLPVGERCAPVRCVLAQQLPQDPARHPLDHVGVSDEDAVVGLVVGDRERLTVRHSRRRGLSRVALAAIRLQHRERGGELPAEDPQQTLLAWTEVALSVALEVEHPRNLSVGKQGNGRRTLNALEARQLDLDRGRLAAASADAVLYGRVHRTAAREVRDAYDAAPLRRNPDQADTAWHLGSHAGRDVAVAPCPEQPIPPRARGGKNRG